MNRPIPLAEAQARLLDGVAPLGSETIDVAKACGRYLAQPLIARRTQPFADLSAMDGYAMRADDPDGPWRVVGESAAGHPFAGELATGQAIRISTGAPMPAANTCVLLQENAHLEDDVLTVSGADGPTQHHVRRKGFDFVAGDVLRAAGTRIDAAALALAVIAGIEAVSLGTHPRLVLIDSGDELLARADPSRPDFLPAGNGAMLAAMCAGLAGDGRVLGPVPDRRDALRAAFEAAADADVIVTTGGASVGAHDLVRPTLEEWGATLDFWRVAIRPGKPLLVARKGRSTILGLPGNPVSAFVTAHLFLLPLLRRLAGAGAPLPCFQQARLAAALPPGGEREEFLRGQWVDGEILPIAERDSSALRALAQADVLIRRPIGAPAAVPGDLVRVLPLTNGGNA